ncbi:hypothetical protein PVAND_015633 [Polypedilum vanderplanki]|uniref:Uncharacterized protein n=1 Tax=Polypedilum vanderplanki TaxID=319348 RepID=A0A9J6BCU4_POLVA|nr:hypothetical protein PVAND_015633 [Polypedilum vanderplanki]
MKYLKFLIILSLFIAVNGDVISDLIGNSTALFQNMINIFTNITGEASKTVFAVFSAVVNNSSFANLTFASNFLPNIMKN